MKAPLVLVAALALGSLTACGMSKPEATSPSVSEATTTAPAPTPTPEPKLSGAFGDTLTYPNGVAVKVAPPAAVPAAQYAYGAVDGKIVVFELSVTNGSKEPLNAAVMSFPKVNYGPTGASAQTATDVEAGIGPGALSTILPGETQTVKLGYGVPAAAYGEVRMEVSGPAFEDKPAIFKGAVG